MRVTRARAQQGHGEATDATERAPLNEITSNAPAEQPRDDDGEELLPAKTPAKTPAKKSKAKGRAKKGKKTKAAEEEEEQEVEAASEDVQTAPEPVEAPASAEDGTTESQSLSNIQDEPVSAAASGIDSSANPSEDAEISNKVQRPVTPTKPVRLTRRQLAMQEEEMKKAQQAAPAAQEPETQVPESTADVLKVTEEAPQVSEQVEEPKAPQTQNGDVKEETVMEPQAVVDKVQDEAVVESVAEREISKEALPDVPQVEEPQTQPQIPEAAADTPVPSVELSPETEPKSLATQKSNEDLMATLRSQASSRRTSRSLSKSPMRLEESFEAIDALEEALENVTSVARIDRLNEETSPERAKASKTTSTAGTRPKSMYATSTTATKLSRASSSAAPKSMKPVKSSLARATSVRTATSKEVKTAPAPTTDYLAVKRRPISVSFPTPAPPTKGRAPTKSTFQLSSNDVVAKLKAQKEERLKREAEGTAPKARPISMPPPPKSTKPLTKPAFQLPGEKIAEKLKAQKEERLKRDEEQQTAPKQRPASISMAPLAKSTKAPTKPKFELPGSAIAEKLRLKKEERLKRMEEAEAAKKEAATQKPRPAPVASRKPVTIPLRPSPAETPGVTIGPPPSPPPPQQQQRSTSLTSKRTSLSLSHPPPHQSRSTSTSSSNRNSILVPKAVVSPADAIQLKLKGKEVFNRDRVEKEARERERREKEEAAKRARAEAAERGRIASREWAERQRRKMMGGS
ncbi:hypothetical protein COCMIDRAFT_28428 [Bipolaris oryzae ATCC 44560]|uniref:Carboxylesterase family protein n=1 Tax=Bipolaris oryzae ATCC 44560 TaxID=930090 RepID=W6YZL4_COCMI|nr:uncharacterized protein COCMIDRAFT_28428 [Bipolaris oryzae ATCC 44560]EUC43055.1 hypothetical protein COCMIDRAFT_28428 [Bipolaris oryzae ATCC 44560]